MHPEPAQGTKTVLSELAQEYYYYYFEYLLYDSQLHYDESHKKKNAKKCYFS